MKKNLFAAVALSAALLPLAASAQNIAVVNGKPVPKARAELLLVQVTKSGQQQRTPELETQVKDEVVLREIFIQEAEKRGVPASADYKAQMDLARQSILIRELFADYAKKNPVTDAEAQAEYDKFKAQNSGKEYRARHILVEKEDEAKAIIASLKKGGKFEEIAKKQSKDPGSGANGGDLDWA
ncbi:MAG: peptidylprolyl isomerase, partial [Paucibacter sp.]|nr:peptidylprolyl isomerase [Roseateles sp.]